MSYLNRLPLGSREVPKIEVLEQMLEAAQGAEPATGIIRKMIEAEIEELRIEELEEQYDGDFCPVCDGLGHPNGCPIEIDYRLRDEEDEDERRSWF